MTIKVLTQRLLTPMTFELIRDRIGAILEAELLNQQALAVAASADPTPYEINVTVEKSFPWISTTLPVINVVFDTSDFLFDISPANRDQQGDSFYNIDCYGTKPSTDDNENPIEYGDELTAKEAQRVARLGNQIIMADLNMQLQFPRRVDGKPAAIVASRMAVQFGAFQPTFGDQPVENIEAFRIRLKVHHVEIPPKVQGDPLEGHDIILQRTDSTIDTDIPLEIEY